MPTLLIRGPDGTLVEKELVGRLTVGCDDDNDLVLRTGGVEKRHANFFADGGEVVIEQLESSAAQTLVDGEPMRGRRRLVPGVRVLIGGYEVQVKPGERQLTVRKLQSETLDEALARAPHAGFPFKVVFVLFAVALAALVGAGLYRRASIAEPEPEVTPPSTDPCADLEPKLRIVRSGPSEQALRAADDVLDCDLLNEEANQAKRTIPRELEGQALYTRAKEFLELGRDDQALEQLEKIAPKTQVSQQALPLATEVALRVAAQAKKSCAAYQKPIATPHCELHDRLMKQYGPKETKAAAVAPLAERIAKRQPEKLLAEPVADWATGHFGDAKVKLQKVLENARLAPLHAQARRENWKQACAAWKAGFALHKGRTDLNGAVTKDCTNRARQLLDGDCKQLAEAAALAVPDDGLGPIIAERQAGLRCKP